MGADRRPSTSVPTEASGWQSTVRRSIARLEPRRSGERAALMVGGHSMSLPVANRRFQRSTTASASARAARSALNLVAPALMSGPRVRTPIWVT
jgi:hypothetical protein